MSGATFQTTDHLHQHCCHNHCWYHLQQMLYPIYWNLIIRELKLTQNTQQVNFSTVLNSLCVWSVIWVEAVTLSMHSPCVVVAAVEKHLSIVSVLVNCTQLYLIYFISAHCWQLVPNYLVMFHYTTRPQQTAVYSKMQVHHGVKHEWMTGSCDYVVPWGTNASWRFEVASVIMQLMPDYVLTGGHWF